MDDQKRISKIYQDKIEEVLSDFPSMRKNFYRLFGSEGSESPIATPWSANSDKNDTKPRKD